MLYSINLIRQPPKSQSPTVPTVEALLLARMHPAAIPRSNRLVGIQPELESDSHCLSSPCSVYYATIAIAITTISLLLPQ